MMEIDGTMGEGGGQILRSSLALSLLTQKPFTIKNIRGKRRKSGLLRQHLTCVRLAKQVGRAVVSGMEMNSQTLTFEPTGLFGGSYDVKIGTAGSAGLVLQSVLPALLAADSETTLSIEGGTHNMASPPHPFLEHAFLPALQEMGAQVSLKLADFGFYPAGGGRYEIQIQPKPLTPINKNRRGEVEIELWAVVSNLPRNIAFRELTHAGELLGVPQNRRKMKQVRSPGPGNAMWAICRFDGGCEVFTAFGERGKSAEQVASSLAREVSAWLESGVPVGEHLADQLLLPMALAGKGSFLTTKPSLHTLTNLQVIERFFSKAPTVIPVAKGARIRL